jgi:hypothetical protein
VAPREDKDPLEIPASLDRRSKNHIRESV